MLRRALLLSVVLGTLAACASTPAVPVGSRLDDLEARLEGPAPFDSLAFNFLVVGDWGRNGFFNQSDVARGMGEIGAELGSRFTVSTGDNFYISGVESVDDPKWQLSYERIYTAPALQSRWYSVLGNHDWQGEIQPQIDYTQVSDRWYMPARYFSETLAVNDTTDVLFVFLDTTPLSEPDENRRKYENTELWDRDRQTAWLDSTLATSTAAWKIVYGHHPIYVGSTSYRDNEALIERIVPILEARGVQAYFAGHDHNLQHHRPQGANVDYFVSGAGSLTRGVVQTPNTLFALRVPGFMAVSMARNRMFVNAYDEDGQLVYATEVPRRRGDRLPLPFGIGNASATTGAP